MAHNWPGNVRQLQNVLERAAIFGDGEEISAEQVRAALGIDGGPAIAARIGIFDEPSPPAHGCGECAPDSPLPRTLWRGRLPTLAESESSLIREALEEASYCRSDTAQRLGIERHQLLRKMRKYGISVPRRLARAV